MLLHQALLLCDWRVLRNRGQALLRGRRGFKSRRIRSCTWGLDKMLSSLLLFLVQIAPSMFWFRSLELMARIRSQWCSLFYCYSSFSYTHDALAFVLVHFL